MEKMEKHIVVGAIICLIAGMVYFPTIFFDYVWDDIIWLNALGRDGSDILSLAFLKPYLIGNVYWRPLAEMTLFIQWGEKPQMLQHGFNILIHLINIGLLVIIGSKSRSFGNFHSNKWLYFFIAFFAFHPAFVEPVAWVSGRFDLLLTTFFLLGVICLITMQGAVSQAVCIGGLYLLSLLIKETAIVFLPVYLGLFWLMHSDLGWRAVIDRQKLLVVALLSLSIVWVIVRKIVLGEVGAGFLLKNIASVMTYDKIYMILSTIGAYVVLLIFPFKNLSTLYPLDQMLTGPWYALLGAACLGGMVWLLRQQGDLKKTGLIIGIFLTSLILVLNILDLGFVDNLIQNRYLYPSFAILLTSIFVSNLKFKLTRLGSWAFSFLAVGWLALSVMNINVTLPLWRNLATLSEWLYVEFPNNPYAANMRAAYLVQAGYVEAGIETAGEVAVRRPSHGAYKILGDGHFILGQCGAAHTYYTYAWDLGAFPEEEIEGLLGMYKIEYHTDRDDAAITKDKVLSLLKKNPHEKEYILSRIDVLESTEIECRDKVDIEKDK
jgi:protein O-mannosyl-transferase